MKFTQIPANTFQNIQMNAGIFVSTFNPATGVIGDILGATSGGNKFSDVPTFKDFGEDIDNCPKNTKELKKLESREVKCSGTFVTVDTTQAKRMIATADIDGSNSMHVIPRNDVKPEDFEDFWWIGDYSDVNDGTNAGFLAIHMMNVLSTGGLQLQSADKDKGKFAYEFTMHYSMQSPDTVPYDLYIKQGSALTIALDKASASVVAGSTVTITATKSPSDATVTWSSSDDDVATVSDGVVTGVAAGVAVIIATATKSGETPQTAICNVIVTAAQTQG